MSTKEIDNYGHFLTMNPFQMKIKDKVRQNEMEFLYSKFMAMKEIEIDSEIDTKGNKLEQQNYSTLKLSKSVVCTNFFDSELGRNDLINILSKM